MGLVGDLVKVGETVLYHHDTADNNAGATVSPAIVTDVLAAAEGVGERIDAVVMNSSLGPIVRKAIPFIEHVAEGAGHAFQKLDEALAAAAPATTTTPTDTATAAPVPEAPTAPTDTAPVAPGAPLPPSAESQPAPAPVGPGAPLPAPAPPAP